MSGSWEKEKNKENKSPKCFRFGINDDDDNDGLGAEQASQAATNEKIKSIRTNLMKGKRDSKLIYYWFKSRITISDDGFIWDVYSSSPEGVIKVNWEV